MLTPRRPICLRTRTGMNVKYHEIKIAPSNHSERDGQERQTSSVSSVRYEREATANKREATAWLLDGTPYDE